MIDNHHNKEIQEYLSEINTAIQMDVQQTLQTQLPSAEAAANLFKRAADASKAVFELQKDAALLYGLEPEDVAW